MTLDEIKDLLAALQKTNVVELNLIDGEFKLAIKMADARFVAMPVSATPGARPRTEDAGRAPAADERPEVAPPPPPAGPSRLTLNAPMVGTFYRATSPDSAPFVEVGDVVRVGQTVCIIEAMKLMNEFEAEAAGRVARFLVDNGEPVEFGQPLIELEPN